MVSFFLFHPLTLEFLSLRCWNSESPHFLILSLPISSLCVFVYAPVDFLNIFFHTFFWDFWFCFHIFNLQEPLSLILSFTIFSVAFPFVVSSPCIVSSSFNILLHGYLFYLHVCLFSLLRHLVTCAPRMGLDSSQAIWRTLCLDHFNAGPPVSTFSFWRYSDSSGSTLSVSGLEGQVLNAGFWNQVGD